MGPSVGVHTLHNVHLSVAPVSRIFSKHAHRKWPSSKSPSLGSATDDEQFKMMRSS